MVTSAVPEEGETSTAVNLALSLARAGTKDVADGPILLWLLVGCELADIDEAGPFLEASGS